MNAYCTYLRVSTQRQGAQGLGISAQRAMCDNFIKQHNGEHAQEFMDVESGTHRDRKGLWDAIEYCQKNNCSLVIAKLDRLARDVEFTFKVINTGIDIHFTDMPVVNSMILGVFAAVAQYERELCSKRTKDALAAKKARGESLGGANEKWRAAYKSKTREQREEENGRRGETKNVRYMQSKGTQTFIRILRNVFPDATDNEDLSKWDWKSINTKGENKQRVLRLMQDYQSIDNTLFVGWTFDESRQTQIKLASYFCTLRNSAKSISRRENNNN